MTYGPKCAQVRLFRAESSEQPRSEPAQRALKVLGKAGLKTHAVRDAEQETLTRCFGKSFCRKPNSYRAKSGQPDAPSAAGGFQRNPRYSHALAPGLAGLSHGDG
jgi:hypothetical protein